MWVVVETVLAEFAYSFFNASLAGHEEVLVARARGASLVPGAQRATGAGGSNANRLSDGGAAVGGGGGWSCLDHALISTQHKDKHKDKDKPKGKRKEKHN